MCFFVTVTWPGTMPIIFDEVWLTARHAISGTTPAIVPRLLDRLILERPKPPLLVGWIALWAILTGRSHIDMLMVCSSVVPFLLLAW